MNKALLIHGIIELLGAIILLAKPEFLFLKEYTDESLHLIRMYGLLAAAVGALSLVLWKHFEYRGMFKQIYLILLAFQVFVVFHLHGMLQTGTLTHKGPWIVHLVLVAVFGLFYFKDLDRFGHEK